MRVFLAVELPEAVRRALAGMQQHLAATGADVKWAAAEQLHVTMKFLGEITDAQRQAVERIGTSVASTIAPIRMRLGLVGTFPSTTSPRVVWVGIEEGKNELAHLAQRLEEELAAESFAREERDFVAHVTLGRVRSSRHQRWLADALQALNWQAPEPFPIEQMALYQSVLSSRGPTHTILRLFPFNG